MSVNRDILKEKQAELERKKKEMAERMAKNKTSASAKEDEVLANAMKLINPKGDSTPLAAAQPEKEAEKPEVPVEKNNAACNIVPIPTILSREPKPKKQMTSIGVQCDLDTGAVDNVTSDKNRPENNKVSSPTKKGAGGEEKDDSPTAALAATVHKISAANMIQKVAKVYTKDELLKLYENEKFERFMRYACKSVENILYKRIDILNMVDEDDLKSPDKAAIFSFTPDSQVTKEAMEIEAAKIVQKVACPEKYEGFMVADMQWNTALPDLLLVNYCKKVKQEDVFTNTPGRMVIWSVSNPHRPEFILSSKTRITKCAFDPYNPAVVFGGMSNGSIGIWDVREKNFPIQKIRPSNEAHFTPIFGLSVVGTRNSYNVISMSSEGKICVWEPSNMSCPILQVPLLAPKVESSSSSRSNFDQALSMNPLTMAAPPGHFSKVFVGGVERIPFNIALSSGQNTSIIAQSFTDQPHQGPICGMSYLTNYSSRTSLTQGLLLTSSFDWTVKLWYPQSSTSCIGTFNAHESIVSDVSWNSMHPAKFASCGADGKLFIWNLLKSTVLPMFEYKMPGVACTKAQWNPDGHHLALSDSEGRVSIFKQSRVANQYEEEHEKVFKEKVNSIATKQANDK
jgi:hypothetical protein